MEDEIPFEVPEGWAWCKLNDIYNFIDYRGATPTKITNGIPLVTAKNVKSGYIDYTIDDYISEEEFKERQQRGISKKGDILFTTEAPLGNAALADMEKFSAGQRLITFQQYGSKNELINYVMLMFILSDFFQQQLYVNKTGSTVAGIKAAILKTLWIPVPPYNEQLRISNTLKSAINLIDSISKNKEILSTSISNTKSKILDLAIRGKIVPQDPNDEPASVLLERIRAEKEELIKQGKIKRDKKESVIFKGDDNSYYEKIGNKVNCIDEEIPFELSEGWAFIRLKTAWELISGRDLSPSEYNDKNDGIPYITGASNFRNGHISLVRWTTVPQVITRRGDLLQTCKGTIGEIAHNNFGEAHIARQIMAIRNIYSLNVDFLALCIEYSMTKIKQAANGLIPGISREDILNLVIPIPPTKEQENICNKLKATFSAIEHIEKSLN